MKKSLLTMLTAVLSIFLLLSTTGVYAHGQHKARIKITNSLNQGDLFNPRLVVYTYNGNDRGCSKPHSVSLIKRGETHVLNCHGKGTKRCKVTVHSQGRPDHPVKYCKAIKRNKNCFVSKSTNPKNSSKLKWQCH